MKLITALLLAVCFVGCCPTEQQSRNAWAEVEIKQLKRKLNEVEAESRKPLYTEAEKARWGTTVYHPDGSSTYYGYPFNHVTPK